MAGNHIDPPAIDITGLRTEIVRQTVKRKRSKPKKPFVAWDGEGCEGLNGYHPYSLFGCGPEHYIQSYNLATQDCLDLVYSANSGIHVSFAFTYDVNNILCDLEPHHFEQLKRTGWTRYGGYNIQHIPRKWFAVNRNRRTVKIYDLFSFFMCSFEDAVRRYGIGTDEERERLRAGKADRKTFRYEEMESKIFPYWIVELGHMRQLAEKIREIISGAGFELKSWHGPSAVAGYVMGQNRAQDYRSTKANTPKQVLESSRYAYYGGRFQAFRAGYHDGPVYSADINSAYGYTNGRIPNLANGTWNLCRSDLRASTTNVRCGLYHLRFDLGRFDPYSPHPLPHRDANNRVSFPTQVEGWYHVSEAYNVRNLKEVEFLEAWIYEDDGTHPFAWFEDMYQKRVVLQRQGDPAEKALKWAIASAYGLRAQRVGWDKKTREPPRFHDLIAAGMITSECRALVFHTANRIAKRGGLISIDTDGVLSTVPFADTDLPRGIGSALGQWEVTEYTGILYYQSGVYWLRDQDGNWLPPKSRGIPRKKLSFDAGMHALRNQKPINASVHNFIGYGLASKRNWRDWRRWVDTNREFTFGGTGKSFHSERVCRHCTSDGDFANGLHDLASIPIKDPISYPHYLPWLDEGIQPDEEYDGWRNDYAP